VTSTQALIRPVITLLSQTSSLAEVPPDVCIAFFDAYLGNDTPYASVHLVAPDGTVSCASRPLNESISFAETSAFHMAMQTTEALVGTYQLDPLSGEGTLPIMQSIIGAGGSPIGVMAFMLRLSH